MSPRHVALIGHARSGKDTVAGRLQSHHAYTRIAFADPLKDMALRINPLVETVPNMRPVRLASLITDVGWEYAKDTYPEVRRLLQHTGQTVRDLDPQFWVRLALSKARAADRWNIPVVVSDCRYPNEAEALRTAGFRLVRVVRPGVAPANAHESETALDGFPTSALVFNGGSLAELYARADALI